MQSNLKVFKFTSKYIKKIFKHLHNEYCMKKPKIQLPIFQASSYSKLNAADQHSAIKTISCCRFTCLKRISQPY